MSCQTPMRVIHTWFPLISIICDLPLYDLNRLITKSFPLNLPLSFIDEQVVFMMTKLFLKMTFLWYVNYRLYNFINVKHLYNFLFFVLLFCFMVSFFLCYWKLVPDSLIFIFLWSYYKVEVHMGRVRAFALLFTCTWSSTFVYFPPNNSCLQ